MELTILMEYIIDTKIKQKTSLGSADLSQTSICCLTVATALTNWARHRVSRFPEFLYVHATDVCIGVFIEIYIETCVK